MSKHTKAEWLRTHYVDRKLSMKECGRVAGVSAMVVHYWLKKHGIPTRDVGAHMRGDENPFLGRPVPNATREKISASLTGKKRTPESIAKQRAAVSGAKNVNFGKPRRHGKTLWLEVPGGGVIAVRSRWEAFFADRLTGQGAKWVYEPETFNLSDGSAYTPDFLSDGVYYEIKGYLSEIDKAKIEGFRAAFPNLTLQVLGLAEMLQLGFRDGTGLVLNHLKIVSGRYATCALCSQRFLAASAGAKYCSKRCNARKPKKKPVAASCPMCDKTVYLPPSKARSQRTCSIVCGRLLGARKRSGAGHWSARNGT